MKISVCLGLGILSVKVGSYCGCLKYTDLATVAFCGFPNSWAVSCLVSMALSYLNPAFWFPTAFCREQKAGFKWEPFKPCFLLSAKSCGLSCLEWLVFPGSWKQGLCGLEPFKPNSGAVFCEEFLKLIFKFYHTTIKQWNVHWYSSKTKQLEN